MTSAVPVQRERLTQDALEPCEVVALEVAKRPEMPLADEDDAQVVGVAQAD